MPFRTSIVRFWSAMIAVCVGLGRLRRHPVLPVVVAIVAAIGVRIPRSEVLAICVRIELRAIAGIFYNGLRQRGSCEGCRGNSGGANQCEFHFWSPRLC